MNTIEYLSIMLNMSEKVAHIEDQKGERKMWRSPIYRFEIEKEDRYGRTRTETTLINVTRSAPPMKIPGKQLKKIFEKITEHRNPPDTFILDLGSARLRNALYLLKMGFNLFCADFEVLYQSGMARKNLEKAREFENFHELIFPDDFYDFDQTFDYIFLINVPTVMPIPIERLALLLIAREKLHADGALLWYSDPLIRNKKRKRTKRFIDGYLSEKKVQETYSFYLELLESEIESMLSYSGFKINEDISNYLGSLSVNSIAYLAEPIVDFSTNLDLSSLIERGTANDTEIYTSDKLASIFEIIQ